MIMHFYIESKYNIFVAFHIPFQASLSSETNLVDFQIKWHQIKRIVYTQIIVNDYYFPPLKLRLIILQTHYKCDKKYKQIIIFIALT